MHYFIDLNMSFYLETSVNQIKFVDENLLPSVKSVKFHGYNNKYNNYTANENACLLGSVICCSFFIFKNSIYFSREIF